MDRCTCEYVDIGIGLTLARPDPDCPEHAALELAVMTEIRQQSERRMGIPLPEDGTA